MQKSIPRIRKFIMKRVAACFMDILLILAVSEVLFPAIPQRAAEINIHNMLMSLVVLSYFILFEYFYQWTPGKYLLHLQVTDISGTHPSFSQIIKRNIAKMIPLEYVSYKDQTWWHERWSGTRVITDSKQ